MTFANLDNWQTLDFETHSRNWLSLPNELARLTQTEFSKFGQFGRFIDFEISVILGAFGRFLDFEIHFRDALSMVIVPDGNFHHFSVYCFGAFL